MNTSPLAIQIQQLRNEIRLLCQTPIEFLNLYPNNDQLDQLTSSQLMGKLRTKILELRNECLTANQNYETVLGLQLSGFNEELNQRNWNRITNQFRHESKSILELLNTPVLGKALAEIDRTESDAIFNDEDVFMTQWNRIRRKSREIVLKTLSTKTILMEITRINLNDKTSEEILEKLDAHLQFTNNHYNRNIQNMIPLQGLRIVKDNEEKLQQIISYVQILELHIQQFSQFDQSLRI